eukprot:TRINITY_DN2731_c0_g1_i1.p1 TRINITY_DN2731_c0_g1~~TRINITY_DN2731_c0_g1_i1.p1  ORF type:complete len:129 (-),score=14.93 TRINITY_DN2731_c0_g1_i1:58-402(-)
MSTNKQLFQLYYYHTLQTYYSPTMEQQHLNLGLPLKQDGTIDKRYTHPQVLDAEGHVDLSVPAPTDVHVGMPLKHDGTRDMRYTHPRVLQADGTPDRMYNIPADQEQELVKLTY